MQASKANSFGITRYSNTDLAPIRPSNSFVNSSGRQLFPRPVPSGRSEHEELVLQGVTRRAPP